jgi:hypothetical protein
MSMVVCIENSTQQQFIETDWQGVALIVGGKSNHWWRIL